MSTMCVIYLSAIPKPSLYHHSMYNKFIRYFNISVFGFFIIIIIQEEGVVWKDLTDVHKCPQVLKRFKISLIIQCDIFHQIKSSSSIDIIIQASYQNMNKTTRSKNMNKTTSYKLRFLSVNAPGAKKNICLITISRYRDHNFYKCLS